jgi:tetratricopeptide (TPR) repeat protein
MRRVLSFALLLGLVACVDTGTAPAQPGKEAEVQATVYFPDAASKKEISVTGIIQEESIVGIKMKIGKETKTIPALDVREITYKTKADALEARKAFSTERKANEPGLKVEKRIEFYKDAVGEYKTLLASVKDIPQAQRYISFKIAEVQLRIGQLDNAKLDDGIKAMEAFTNEFPQGWEVVPSLKLLADAHETKGNPNEASKVYEKLAELPDAPEEVKRTAGMLVTQMLLRGKKFKEAEAKLIALRKRLPDNDPQVGQVTVMLVQSQMMQGKTEGVEKQLRDALATNPDLYLHSVGHNCLGDLFLAQKKPEAAFWEFLKVHLMYSQDRTEHARALYNLWKLFDSVKNDPVRAGECLDRLLNDKDYIGTEWQTRAKAEAKPTPTPMP